MTKVMIFIDGSWLYANTGKLAQDYARPDLQIDYGLLPDALCRRVAEATNVPVVDIVRTSLFASIPDNYDMSDQESVRRRLDFFNLLKEEHHYEVELFPIDFRGRRIRSVDRDPTDTFEPREKCVDIALASSMLYYAAIPQVYDIAIAVIGDQDYVPVLQHVRRLGKRVAIASVRGSCAQDYADPVDPQRVKDIDLMWLNDMIGDIELRYEPRQLVCQSEFHVGDRLVWTTYRPRRNQPFFCDECRREFAERHQEGARRPEPYQSHIRSAPAPTAGPLGSNVIEAKTGKIYEIKDERRFGFIRADDGLEYFFHLTDLNNIVWQEVVIGMEVEFLPARAPTSDRAGKATDIDVLDYDEYWELGDDDESEAAGKDDDSADELAEG